VAAAALRIPDRSELLRETCRLAVGVGGYAAAVACAKIGANPANQPVAWHGTDTAQAETLRAVCVAAANAPGGALSRAMQTNQPFVSNNPEVWLKRKAPADGARAADLPTIIVLPIVVDGSTFGALWLATSHELDV